MPGLRDAIKSISPPWLQTGIAEKFLYVCGLGMDALLEKVNEGVRMRMPGYGDASGLPYIGNDRLIPQGANESNNAYALRLKYWLDDWQIAGDARSVLQQLLGYVSPAQPMMRTVSNSSAWDTFIEGANAQTDTPAHFLGNNWNWDNNGDPHLPTQIPWWRWWLAMFAGTTNAGGSIIAATTASPILITTSLAHGLSSGAQVFVEGVNGNLPANGLRTITVTSSSGFTLNGSVGSGAYTGGGVAYALGPNNWVLPGPSFGTAGVTIGQAGAAIGVSVSPGYVTGIRNLVGLWKAAQSWCRWMIVAFDAGLFDPNQFADAVHNPLGGFQQWSKIVNNQYVSARFGAARYADGIATSGNQGPYGWPPSGNPGFPTY